MPIIASRIDRVMVRPARNCEGPDLATRYKVLTMEQIWQEIITDVPSMADFCLVSFRLSVAMLVGALPGYQRELTGEAAGLRTHMLVSLGSAVFVIAALGSHASVDATTRVIQGLATGIGFIGAGAILKSAQHREIHGLTTAASIWLTAGLGTAVGMGRFWMPLLGSIFAVFILSTARRIEPRKSWIEPPV
jgi:putative Mg2+ transporter-C (MgtC) family protein